MLFRSLAGCADKAPSIKSLEINGQGELLVIMTDGTVTNLGKVKGEDGSDGADGQNGAGIASVYVNGDGVLVFNFTDGTSKEAGKVVGNDGVGVKSAYIDSNSNLIIVLSDGQTINCGNAGSGTPSQAGENFYFAEAEENGQTTGYIVRGLGSISYPDIIVPSYYRGKPVVSVGENAFFNCKYITGVTLPDTVGAIDYCARRQRAKIDRRQRVQRKYRARKHFSARKLREYRRKRIRGLYRAYFDNAFGRA